jgi:hypothetical protein
MQVTEVSLANRSELYFRGRPFATVESSERGDRPDGLELLFAGERRLELPAAADVGEEHRIPRLFLIGGNSEDSVFIFGGEKAYRLSTKGEVEGVVQTFRSFEDAEYWATKFIQRAHDIVIIYEAGVMVLNETLNVTFQKRKLFNDFFVSMEADSIKFVTDHETEWHMQLT